MATIDTSELSGPALVTIAYLIVYYLFICNVAYVKHVLTARAKKEGKKFDRYFNNDREMLAADRIQLNTLEQMGPFLAGLWMHAIFVSAANATIAGSIYVAVRLLYPFVVGSRLGRGIRVAVLAVTVPNYGAIIYLIGGTLIHLL